MYFELGFSTATSITHRRYTKPSQQLKLTTPPLSRVPSRAPNEHLQLCDVSSVAHCPRSMVIPAGAHTLACYTGAGLATIQAPLVLAPGATSDAPELTFNTHAFAAAWGTDFFHIQEGADQVRELPLRLSMPFPPVSSQSLHARSGHAPHSTLVQKCKM
jgi:hypothetical protein